MNIYDAAKLLSLTGEITQDDIKEAYREACKKYHPDINPAGDEMMKIINQAYDVLKDFSGAIKDQETDYGDKLNEALNAVLGLSGLVIEICGSWVWVTGETRRHKDALKDARFQWASKKKAWYFRPEEFRSRSQGKTTLKDIREKYGTKSPGLGRNLLGGV